MVTNGVLVSSTATFEPVLLQDQDNPTQSAKLRLTATIYYQTTVVTNSGNVLLVPKGALKFSAEITKWKFQGDDHVLALGMSITGRLAPNATETMGSMLPYPTMSRMIGNDDINVVMLGAGMVMDVPFGVTLDGTDTKLGVDLPSTSNEIVWTFNKFNTKATYDPVLRYEDPLTTVSFTSAKGTDDKPLIPTAVKFMKNTAAIQFFHYSNRELEP
ncbi:hypothetical protein Poli38472_005765 [Pythium oligandrum]|uniref:Uncharacterized protein n=1 Tax=Pythium oligandrum TaxID=41045 RepID=A0A8K1FQT6_PYTOL|nr:hypothetical protein Poli38472_005765 [Pythium oligandrum]|eukprot:TMW68297.1 hypothetical protein Poli38472_005765 [Pythium oligandrum]